MFLFTILLMKLCCYDSFSAFTFCLPFEIENRYGRVNVDLRVFLFLFLWNFIEMLTLFTTFFSTIHTSFAHFLCKFYNIISLRNSMASSIEVNQFGNWFVPIMLCRKWSNYCSYVPHNVTHKLYARFWGLQKARRNYFLFVHTTPVFVLCFMFTFCCVFRGKNKSLLSFCLLHNDASKKVSIFFIEIRNTRSDIFFYEQMIEIEFWNMICDSRAHILFPLNGEK
jgi:hypothetical protein